MEIKKKLQKNQDNYSYDLSQISRNEIENNEKTCKKSSIKPIQNAYNDYFDKDYNN